MIQLGQWVAPHSIYLSDVAVHDFFTARHEILHNLVGHAGHPAAVFSRCGLLHPDAPG